MGYRIPHPRHRKGKSCQACIESLERAVGIRPRTPTPPSHVRPRDSACQTCGAVAGLNGADHPGRPPFFDARATAALDGMARLDRLTPPTTPHAEEEEE